MAAGCHLLSKVGWIVCSTDQVGLGSRDSDHDQRLSVIIRSSPCDSDVDSSMMSTHALLILASEWFCWAIERIHRLAGGEPVANITTTELRQLQLRQTDWCHAGVESDGEAARATFILVDVRSDKEQAISMLPGAISQSQFEAGRKRYADRLVIPYCTVGGRSQLYAQKLSRRGVETRNYQASILGWCEAGLPLVTRDGKPTRRVHVYSSVFRVPGQYESIT